MTLASAGAAMFGLTQLAGRLQALHFSAYSLYESTLFIRDYESFVGRRPEPEPDYLAAPRGFDGVRAEDVTFRYPGAERPCARWRLGRDRPRRDRRARGRERIGQDDAREVARRPLPPGVRPPVLERSRHRATWSPEDLRDQIAVIFQDFERYRLTRPPRTSGSVVTSASTTSRRSSRRQSRPTPTTSIRRLPDGYDTLLGTRVLGRLRPLDRPVAARGAGARVLPRRAAS